VRLVGQLIGLFSFDVGYEIDLEKARTLIAAGEMRGMERKRAAPPHLAYAATPVYAPLQPCDTRVGDTTVHAAASARIHDFGAVTVVLAAPLEIDVAALPRLTATLTGAGPLEDTARDLLEELFARIRPAITKPTLNPFVEDYYVVQVDRFDPPATIPELLARERPALASALRCEPVRLSDAEIDDVFRPALSYYPDDLVVTDWNIALVVDDTDYADTVNVLEYLNIQLLELRYYDALLDKHMTDTVALATRRARGLPLLYRPYRRAADELAVIRLDVAAIVERVHNALKLSGDLYLAKVYARTADRLALRAWEESVARKLEVVGGIHSVLTERVSTARAEALEATIVLLIVVEIALYLAGWT
jgi:hypothetical protein